MKYQNRFLIFEQPKSIGKVPIAFELQADLSPVEPAQPSQRTRFERGMRSAVSYFNRPQNRARKVSKHYQQTQGDVKMDYGYWYAGAARAELEDSSKSCEPMLAWSKDIDSFAPSELPGSCAEYAHSKYHHPERKTSFLEPPPPPTPSTTASLGSYERRAQGSFSSASSRRYSLMMTPNSSIGARSILSPVPQTLVTVDTMSPGEGWVEPYDQTVDRWPFDPGNTMEQFQFGTEVRDLPTSYNELGLPTMPDESPSVKHMHGSYYMSDTIPPLTIPPPAPQLSQVISPMIVRSEPKDHFPSIACDDLECGKIFTGRYARGNMRRHYFSQHGSRVGVFYRCHECDKKYSRSDALRAHEERVHPTLRQSVAII